MCTKQTYVCLYLCLMWNAIKKRQGWGSLELHSRKFNSLKGDFENSNLLFNRTKTVAKFNKTQIFYIKMILVRQAGNNLQKLYSQY